MKILMVCLGNICRSPLAEGILRSKIIAENLAVEVDSAGTSDYHIGEPPDKRSSANALSHGIDLSMLRGRQFTEKDFDDFDRIFVMDTTNYSNVINLARSLEDRKKVELILNVPFPASNRSVPDPYFGGEEGFEIVFHLLDEACNSIIKQLKGDTGKTT
jgi:protein-tyrosine phosphatase